MKSENVLAVPLAALETAFQLSRQFWTVAPHTLNRLPFTFIPRQQAESDFAHKQLIPYVLLFDAQNRVLTYQRHGSETRLAGRLSAGIGGHVHDGDMGQNLYEHLLSGLKRELLEETGLTFTQVVLLGMINEDESAVGRCHIGVVFRLALEAGQQPDLSAELAAPAWLPPGQLDLSRFELWSSLALRLADAQGGGKGIFA